MAQYYAIKWESEYRSGIDLFQGLEDAQSKFKKMKKKLSRDVNSGDSFLMPTECNELDIYDTK
jgi:hypothetical protein